MTAGDDADDEWRALTAAELERQCQPSQWSHQPVSSVLQLFVSHCQQGSVLARQSLAHRLAVRCTRTGSVEGDTECARETDTAGEYSTDSGHKQAPLYRNHGCTRSQDRGERRTLSTTQQENRTKNELQDNNIYNEQMNTRLVVDTDCQSDKQEEECCQHPHSSTVDLPLDIPLWDEYGCDLPPNTKHLIVFVHGGYWQEMSSHISAAPALNFTSRSDTPAPQSSPAMPLFAVSYPLAPQATLCQIEQHVQHVAEHLVALSARTRQHVMLIGHSAGAHLVACMLIEWHRSWQRQRENSSSAWQPAVSAVYISGVFNLEPLVNTTVNEALRLTADSARRHSVNHWPRRRIQAMDAACLRQLVLVGQHESPEFHRQSQRFATRLQLSTGCKVMAGHDHFTICQALADRDSDVTGEIERLILRPAEHHNHH